jgi:hypothetical protein
MRMGRIFLASCIIRANKTGDLLAALLDGFGTTHNPDKGFSRD